MPDKNHREKLFENMEEEKGNPQSSKIEEKPHVEIYKNFKEQIGINAAYEIDNPASKTVLVWRELFLQKCRTNIDGVGVGAIGLATEYIVPMIYPYIIKAIHEHSSFEKEASLFFDLHVECDEEHGDAVIELTRDVAENIETREAIRFSVFSSLNLRKAFWDVQFARAWNMAE